MSTNKKLNSIDEFYMGFKIERNGQIITLTDEEMEEFRALDLAQDALSKMELCEYLFDIYSDEEKEKIEQLKHNEKWLTALQTQILYAVECDSYLDTEIISNEVEEYLKGESQGETE